MSSIVPIEYSDKLDITSAPLSSAEIRELTIQFNEWMKAIFPEEDLSLIHI